MQTHVQDFIHVNFIVLTFSDTCHAKKHMWYRLALYEFAWEALRHTFEDRQNMLRAEKPRQVRRRLRKGSGHTEIKLLVHETYEFRSTQALIQRHRGTERERETHTFLGHSSVPTSPGYPKCSGNGTMFINVQDSLQNWMSWRKVFCGLLDGGTAGCSGLLIRIPRIIDFIFISFGAVHAVFFGVFANQTLGSWNIFDNFDPRMNFVSKRIFEIERYPTRQRTILFIDIYCISRFQIDYFH